MSRDGDGVLVQCDVSGYTVQFRTKTRLDSYLTGWEQFSETYKDIEGKGLVLESIKQNITYYLVRMGRTK